MRRLLLAAIAVLSTASVVLADPLPPVPKAANRTTIILKDVATPAPEPTPAPAPTQASKPSTTEARVEAIVKAEAPLPPVPEKTEAKQSKCCMCIHCQAKRNRPVIHFLASEFVAKPVYGVERAMNDAEGRRICRENCRLNVEAEKLACEAACLAEKAKGVCDCDLHAKLKLLKEESEYAKKANKHVVNRAALECKQSRYCTEKQRLDEKHKLFPARDCND